MAEIIRNRTIRPSSRHKSSKNYRVDTSKVKKGDTLLVNVYHESKPFLKSFRFGWKQVINRNITFSTKTHGKEVIIGWNKVKPIELGIEPKILLCRIAWMKYYNGRANIDVPVSGAKYILKNKKGGEIHNFKNRNGKVYGYFPFINSPSIQNLGADRTSESVKGITVVFCSKHPKEGGIRIVGWYKNATVFSYPPPRSDNKYFHAVAENRNARLIPENDRIFLLQEIFGRNSLFYFSRHAEKAELLKEIKKYIANNGKVSALKNKTKNTKGWKGGYQLDILKRLKIEKRAILMAFKYYRDRYGFENVRTVERDNKGWDIEIRSKLANINVEVKGNSGSELFVQLTPNEYSIFSKNPLNYHLFVVNNTLLRKPIQRVFQFHKIGNRWLADDDSILKVNIVKSARINLL